MSDKRLLRSIEGDRVGFWCPGCKEAHVINRTWQISGEDTDAPTISPSVLIRSGHFTGHFTRPGECWCTYSAAHPDDPAPFACFLCHSFVRDGKIQFLSDSSHSLAGQTVPMVAF